MQRLASLIEQDLRRRGLASGDPYLTASEAGDDFGVDPFTATRAMSLLAKRGILIRKRGVGTFVGQCEPHPSASALRCIHILKGPARDDARWSFPVGELVEGLHESLPGYQVQSDVLSPQSFADFVRQVIERRTADGSLAGMILMGCPREVQELVLAHRVPAVIFGSAYPNTRALPSVDVDQYESGRLQAGYLLARGHRRLMLLMRETWRPGDNRLVDGVNRAMADAGLSFGALVTRSIPEEVALVRNEIERLLSLEDRPTGLICRCLRFAETALEVVQSRSLRVPEDLDVVFNHYDRAASAPLALPRVCPRLSSRQQVALVAQTLDRVIGGMPLATEHATLSVELVEPNGKC
ncbi:MAG: substrate-binding domain-containing protein [Planctomycetia bacterium]|nr:substrate-binding domain-containing protein [Planctomycetia bacterium]